MDCHPGHDWRLIALLRLLAACVVFYAVLSPGANAVDEDSSPAAESPAAAGGDRVLATVNGRAIRERHLRREIDRIIAERRFPPDDAIRRQLFRPTLELLIDRQVVLDALRRDNRAASDAEVELEVSRVKAALKRIKGADARRQGDVDDDGPPVEKLSDDDLRHDIAWRLSWRQYCEAELTDDAIAAYFGKHRRQFDGTRLRVSHILFGLPKDADEVAARQAIERAARLRERIVAGEISFADAARRSSDAPTKTDGGDIGFITRRGEQHESFAAAAFVLAVGEISQPVQTPHGVHLIQCTAEEPGRKKLADVRDGVVRAAQQHLFRARAAAERPKAKIEYAGRAANDG